MSFCRSSLSHLLAVVVAGVAAPAVAADYTVPVDLPACDSNDAQVKIIRNNGDWDALNNAGKRIFCVEAGDYSGAGVLDLRRDGSGGAPRVLRYFDPSNPDTLLHPIDQNESQRAVVRGLNFTDARNWVVYGLTSRAGSNRLNPTNRNTRFLNGSARNVLDHMLIEHGRASLVDFRSGSSHNTIQNSVVRRSNIVPDTDRMCSNVTGENTEGNQLIHNEMYDCAGDIIQLSPRSPGNNKGTLVADNDMYTTPDLYTDCNGNRNGDPGADCACSENAIDIKAVTGGDSSGEPRRNWAKFIDNRIWGWRPSDNACGSTGSSGPAITIHYGPSDFILFKGNIIFDSEKALSFSAQGANNISVLSNIIWENRQFGISMNRKSDRVEAYYNTFVDNAQNYLHPGGGPATNEFYCNTVVNSGSPLTNNSDIKSDWNALFDSTPLANPGDNNLTFGAVSAAEADPFCFTTKIWTASEQVCVPHVLLTANSPHRDHCKPNLGARAGIGVNDTTDTGFFRRDWSTYGASRVQITADPAVSAVGSPVDFEATLDADVQAESVTWDFGDGGQATGASTRHGYDSAGRYTVTVTVETSGGAALENTVAVEVVDPQVVLAGRLADEPVDAEASPSGLQWHAITGNGVDMRFAMAWRSAGAYLFVQAIDDSIEVSGDVNPWNNDGIEVGFDTAHDRDGLGADDVKLILSANGAGRFGSADGGQWSAARTPDGFSAHAARTDGGWSAVARIPASLLGADLADHPEMGLVVTAIDRDNGQPAKERFPNGVQGVQAPRNWALLRWTDTAVGGGPGGDAGYIDTGNADAGPTDTGVSDIGSDVTGAADTGTESQSTNKDLEGGCGFTAGGTPGLPAGAVVVVALLGVVGLGRRSSRRR